MGCIHFFLRSVSHLFSIYSINLLEDYLTLPMALTKYVRSTSLCFNSKMSLIRQDF